MAEHMGDVLDRFLTNVLWKGRQQDGSRLTVEGVTTGEAGATARNRAAGEVTPRAGKGGQAGRKDRVGGTPLAPIDSCVKRLGG